MANDADTASIPLFILTIGAIILNVVSTVVKLCKEFRTPKLWKYSLLYQDLAYLCLSLGLFLFCVNLYADDQGLCDATGFWVVFGLFQCLLSYFTTAVILLSVQNPGKPATLSSFHRNVAIAIIIPEVFFSLVISFLPYVSRDLFDTDVTFDVICVPIRDHDRQGSTYGTLVVIVWWLILIATGTCDVISILKLWKYNNRVNTARTNVWQSELISQGKQLIKLSLIEHIGVVLVIIIVCVAIYSDITTLENNSTWIFTQSLALLSIVHGVLSNISDVMWTSCCCRDDSVAKEPHRKLKKLELLRIHAPGRIHMKATWTVGKHATKRGRMKVYGVDHLKSWAQEIVMLGMLRRTQHPSLIQCLWTNSSNPYYETMTLISGEIITSDSRIICLELTNAGTLQDFLQKCELPLPEPCQRMIIHDIAEGLFYLHHENIMHNNLTTACIYLKGSLQSMVLRAAIGDFEDAQIYGTLQIGLESSLRDKKYFFLPDIRSFALIAIEIVGKMCEKRFQNRYVNYNTEQVPMKMSLETVISDEDDEFGAQYGYEAEDTYRMFDAVHTAVVLTDEEYESEGSDKEAESRRHTRGSLENLMTRPLSPIYSEIPAVSAKKSSSKSKTNKARASTEDEEAMRYITSVAKENRQMETNDKENSVPKRCLSPDVSGSSDGSKVSSRKSRKDALSKSVANATRLKNGVGSPERRSLSPMQHTHQSDKTNRCVSPDPMHDEILQELRKETNMKPKQGGKKERKSSFSRKKSEENVYTKGRTAEAFVKSNDEKDKRKDSNWLSKPTSILKSIASNDTAVSVFKAKLNDEDNHLDAIEEEDIGNNQSAASKTRQIHVKEKPRNEVWDIIDEQYYKQVNRKAKNNLKKTISSESKSSLWSFISTPEDLDDDDLDDILDCLPGMTDPSDLRASEMKVSAIIAEREKAYRQEETKKKFSFSEFLKSKSKFELIDYYELLKSKHITIHDVPEDKREMLLNVVELKKEERLRRANMGKTGVALRSDEMYENNMFQGGSNTNSTAGPHNVGKNKLVSFRQGTANNTSKQTMHDPRQERARSVPLKRPRTPMHKPSVQKPPEVNPAFADPKNGAKRNKARAALKRALNNKTAVNNIRNDDRGRGQTADLAVKYATIRKMNANSVTSSDSEQQTADVLTVPVPSVESFSLTSKKTTPVAKPIKRYPSFSSNESASSIGSSVHQRRTDVSITSGEFSSLSSQAESEHYETDANTSDARGTSKSNPRYKQAVRKPSSRVDSGFDSGSMSSEMSDAFMNRAKQFNPQVHSNKNGAVNSWARNYKMVDTEQSTSPYSATNKFNAPQNDHKQNNTNTNRVKYDSDKASVDSGYAHSKSRGKAKQDTTQGLKSLNMSPYGTVSSRPMSPLSRPMSPQSRPTTASSNRPMSPQSRPMSPLASSSRPMSPPSRPMSPESRPVSQLSNSEQYPVLNGHQPMSSARPMSPEARPNTPNTRPTSPLNRPMSPNVQPTGTRMPRPVSRSKSMSNQTHVVAASKATTAPPTKSAHQTFTPGRQLTKPAKLPPSIAPIHHRAKSYPRSSESGDQEQKESRHQRVRSLSPAESVRSDTASKASRRYREFMKQGVPLRTSVIDASPTRGDNTRGDNEESDVRLTTEENTTGQPFSDDELFENLDANGFFAPKPAPKSRYKNSSPNRSRSPNPNTENNATQKKHRHRKKHIPLEELVRENPSGKPQPPAHRSPSKNHLIVSEEAFLNQPASEDSETCSIKTNKSNVSTPSGCKPKVMVDAELVIDRIFSQNQPPDYELDVEVEAALGLDKDPFKAVNELYLNGRSPNPTDLDTMPLLNGVGQKHIHGCMELATGLHVITVRDLLPATQDSFEILRTKLQQIGQLGTVGNQLLDIIQRCWLLDMPPSSGDLVEQLTDPVTETEL